MYIRKDKLVPFCTPLCQEWHSRCGRKRGGEGFKRAVKEPKNEKVIEKKSERADQLKDIENYHESMVYDQTKKGIITI